MKKIGFLVIVVFLGIFYFKTPSFQKVSRGISSLRKTPLDIKFISKKKLLSLSAKKQYLYVRRISEILMNSQFLSVVQNHKKNMNIFLEEAWGDEDFLTCPIQGLMPMKKKTERECKQKPVGVSKVDGSHKDKFQDVSWVKSKSGQFFPGCSKPLYMCNPLAVGFEFDNEGKAKVRCLVDATNKKCFELKVSIENLNKSIKLLNDINPNFWKDYTDGVKEICSEEDKEKDKNLLEIEACEYVKKRINMATSKVERALSQTSQVSVAAESANSICKILHGKSEKELKNLENFNQGEGQKIFFVKNKCYRFPYDTVVSEENDEYIFSSSGEHPIELAKISSKNGGRFYNFNCGGCNKADNAEDCFSGKESKTLEEEEEIEMSYDTIDSKNINKACDNLILFFEEKTSDFRGHAVKESTDSSVH